MEFILFRSMEKESIMNKKIHKIAFLSHLDLNLYLFRLPIMIALIKEGHKVYAICPKGDKFDEFEQYGIEALSYDISRKSLNPFKELKTIRNIYKVVKRLDLDILHNFTAKPNIYGSIAGHLAKVPNIINSVTGLGSFYIQKTKKAQRIRLIMEKLYKEANKKVNHVIFQNSDDMRYFIRKKLVRKDQAVLIKSSGINSSIFDINNVEKATIIKLKKELNLSEKIVVLMVSRAIWHKGVKEYYDAAKILSSKYENIKFVFVGDTDENNLSCANEEYLKKPFVSWLGHRDDILNLTALSDICVLPSYREGVPRTLLEAASMSKAIVTTKAIGCKEVVDDGINGYLVPVRNTKQLVNKIEKLFLDENLRKIMGKKARMKVLEEFDVDVVVKKYLDVYDAL